MLDIACGAGRHSLYFSAQGHEVTAVDRDETALAALRARDADDASKAGAIHTMLADLENARFVVADPDPRRAGAWGAATRAAEAAEAAMADMTTGTSGGTKPACVRVCAEYRYLFSGNIDVTVVNTQAS